MRWTVDDQRFVHTTAESTKFVHERFTQHGDGVGELEVRRASLEEVYMTLARRHEYGELATAVHTLAEVTRRIRSPHVLVLDREDGTLLRAKPRPTA